MNRKVAFLCLGLSVLLALPLLAQGRPTGKVTGIVTHAETGEALPGVRVTLTSPALQGERVLHTESNGQYSSPPLPPGEYEISFELEGFQSVAQRVRLNAGMVQQVDASLDVGTVVEEIVVTGEATETISETSTSGTTMPREDLENLPVARTLESAISLAPGVSGTGPGGNISISGAQSFDNLFTLNGVVLNENVRGQPFDLFIEDAIQETTVLQGGAISSEYGRFTGGVVTAITKSGGNNFEGSFRASFDNEDWVARNEFSPERIDKTNDTLEATVGGRIVRDRLWFFGAGRSRDVSFQETTRITNIPFQRGNEEDRLEGKLTAAVTPSHQLQGTIIDIDEQDLNVPHGGLVDFVAVVDDGSIDPVRDLPQELKVFNYTGVITNNFFLEAQYSEREFAFDGSGGTDQAIDTGTPVFDLVNGLIFNESAFCDNTVIPECIPEDRNNEAARLKGSYFLSTGAAGSHDIGFGGETFTDIRAADNHQSPNDLFAWNFVASEFTDDGQVLTPLLPGGATLLMYLPILNPTEGTDFQTDSFFVNDSWRLNDKWSLNLGARFDTVDAVNSLGNQVADSDTFAPRLGASYDVNGDGRNVLHFSAGRYNGQAANTVFDSTSSAGNPASFGFLYNGPAFAPLDSVTFNQEAWGWLFDNCPTALDDPFSCPFLAIVDIPGATTVLSDDLSGASNDELTVGYQRDLGRRGNVRVDYVYRDGGDFFFTKRDLETGIGTDDQGNQFDLGRVINEDSRLERRYDGVSVAFNLGFLDRRLRVGGNATWSNARGTFNGETFGSGPVTSGIGEYPQYKEDRWNNPRGPLGVDQRWRGRVWAMYDVLRAERNYLNVSLLQSFFAGTPFSATGNIDSSPFVTNPGFVTPPTSVTYFFSGRGEFETDDITRTDLAVNYSFNFKRFEFFVQPEVLNVFDEDSVVGLNTSVSTALDGAACPDSPTGQCLPFNPFTETPVENVHWVRGPDFGQSTDEDDLQVPRTFRFSVGFRWNP